MSTHVYPVTFLLRLGLGPAVRNEDQAGRRSKQDRGVSGQQGTALVMGRRLTEALTHARPLHSRSGQAGNNPVREVSGFYRQREGDSTKTGGRPARRKGRGAGGETAG